MSAVAEATAVADRALSVTYLPLDALRPDPRNARTHPPRQIEQIAASIRTLGFANPILIDADSNVIAGHGRLMAARAIGMAEVPTIALHGLSDAQKRALRLADNRIALGSGWDQKQLRLELTELAAMDFDLSLTGFSTGEIARATHVRGKTATKAGSEAGTALPRPRVLPGDIWQLGGHRLGCGDGRNAAFLRAVVGEGAVDAAFLDPRAACADAAVAHRLSEWLTAGAAVSRTGAVHFLCCDWRGLGEMRAAADSVYGAPLNLCVWTGGTARDDWPYRSRHALVLVYRHGSGEAGARRGQGRSDVWEHVPDRAERRAAGAKAGAATLAGTSAGALPIALIADAMADVVPAGGMVLDLFPAGGATLIAAERSGRQLRATDGDPDVIDAAIARWSLCTGGVATRVAAAAA